MTGSRFRWLGVVVGLIVVAHAAGVSAAPIIWESATMGPDGQGAGPAVSATQLVGWRFRVTSSVSVTEVGGHLGRISGQLFAAIMPLESIDALPPAPPFTASPVLGSAAFTPPAVTADVRVPLSVLLSPGSYALVFGSGQFGAAGSGLILNSQQTNIEPTIRASYVTWRQTLPGVFEWTVGSLDNLRFVVVGREVEGATDYNLDGRISGEDLGVWRSNFGSTIGGLASGDGDRDGDNDGADFLAWQRTLAPAPTPASSAIPTPEPGSIAMLTVACAGASLICRLGRRT